MNLPKIEVREESPSKNMHDVFVRVGNVEIRINTQEDGSSVVAYRGDEMIDGEIYFGQTE